METSVDPDNEAKGALSTSDTPNTATTIKHPKSDAPSASTEFESVEQNVHGFEIQAIKEEINEKQKINNNAYIEDKRKEVDKHSENQQENKTIHINSSTLESFDNSTKIIVQSKKSQKMSYEESLVIPISYFDE